MQQVHAAAHSDRAPEALDYVVAMHRSDAALDLAKAIVLPSLSRDGLEALELERFRAIVASAQDDINRAEMTSRIANAVRDQLTAEIGDDDILVQSNCYLRATRPNINATQEAVGWHRESMYGPDMHHSFNVWTPLANVSIGNTLRYVPGSAAIPDEDIQISQAEDPQTPRFSAGHKIGLLYAPKQIVGGVDLTKARPMIVPHGASSIFSGDLIHGAAENRSKAIRISIDFRTIAKKHYKTAKDHFASGKPYFVELPTSSL